MISPDLLGKKGSDETACLLGFAVIMLALSGSRSTRLGMIFLFGLIDYNVLYHPASAKKRPFKFIQKGLIVNRLSS
jgi:hypothetical protein